MLLCRFLIGIWPGGQKGPRDKQRIPQTGGSSRFPLSWSLCFALNVTIWLIPNHHPTRKVLVLLPFHRWANQKTTEMKTTNALRASRNEVVAPELDNGPPEHGLATAGASLWRVLCTSGSFPSLLWWDSSWYCWLVLSSPGSRRTILGHENVWPHCT